MRIYLALCVWGKDYISNFIEITLPTLFAKGNLSSIENAYTLAIYTNKIEVSYFENSEIFNKYIEKYTINLEYIIIDYLTHSCKDKYNILSKIQKKSIENSLNGNYEIYFPIYSDMVYSSNVMNYSIEKIRNGKTAVFSCAPQIITSSVKKYIDSIAKNENEKILEIDPIELTRFALKEIHPSKGPSFYKEKLFKNFPTVFFLENHKHIFLKAFHLHPIALKLSSDITLRCEFKGTFDEDFVPILFNDITRVHVVDDTSEMFICSHEDTFDNDTEASYYDPSGFTSIEKIINVAEAHTNLIHRDFFVKNIYFCEGTPKDKLNFNIMNEINEFTNIIVNRLNLDDGIVKKKYPYQYKNRKIKKNKDDINFNLMLTQINFLMFSTKITSYFTDISFFINNIKYNGILKPILYPFKLIIMRIVGYIIFKQSDIRIIKLLYRNLGFHIHEYNVVMRNYISSRNIFYILLQYIKKHLNIIK